MQETFSIATILNLNQSLNNFTTKGKCTIELNQSTFPLMKYITYGF